MIDSKGVLSQLITHAQKTGHFEKVVGHEPKNAPGMGITGAFWLTELTPVPSLSGLAVTSIRLTVNCRIYTPAIDTPGDAIDIGLLDATDALMEAYTGDFELESQGATDYRLDLLGETGVSLSAQAGYVSADSKLLRIMNITIPVIVNDTWSQEG